METNAVQQAMNSMQDMFAQTPEWVETAKELFLKFGLQLLAAILIFFIGRWVAKVIEKLLEKMMVRAKVEPAVVSFTCNLSYAALMVFVILAALGRIGVETTSFIAVLGAAGLAVGLALQGSLSNFAAGVLIILFRPFKAGDYVEGAGTAGVVKNIQIFTTTLTSLDNKRVIVPNSKMMGDNIINYSAEGTRRLDLVASISYGDSIDKAKAALMDEITKHPAVLKDPVPFIGVLSMSDSSIDLAVRPWVKVEDYWDVFFALNEGIKKRIEAEGLTIPFPQRDVHLYKHDA
ncbi:MAG: mechanosensitive ion channel family protein [Kiritimatiellales bacterium]